MSRPNSHQESIFPHYNHLDDILVSTIYNFKVDNGYMPTFREIHEMSDFTEHQLRTKINKLRSKGKIKVYGSKDHWNMRINV